MNAWRAVGAARFGVVAVATVAAATITAIAGLSACAHPTPKAETADVAEVAIAPMPVASSRRGEERPPPAPPSRGASLQVASKPISDEDRERDPRIRPLAKALLVLEADQLQKLLAQTQRGAPDYPQLLLRVGHAYGSVEAAAWQEGDTNLVQSARRAALDTYERFLKELPAHADAVEALYFAGLSFERSGDAAKARKYWFEVVSKHPTHRLVPACYYGFAVYFRALAENDAGQRVFALQSFKEVTKYQGNPLASRAQRALDESGGEPVPAP